VVILTSLPPEFPEKELENLAGFITEIAVDQRTQDLKEGIANVMSAYSHSKKAKKAPANSLGELFEIAPAKLFKEEGILKKPKGPLEFVFKPNR
jgi:hypothetical protein